MSNTTMFPAPQNFNLQETVAKITQMYQAKGFTVNAIPLEAGASIDFRKDDSGIKKYVGLALGIKANIIVQGGNVIVNYTDAEWTGKIIGLAVGWIFCLVPFICAIIGCVNQSGFPKSIGNDIQMVANSAKQAYAPVQQQYVAPQPQPQTNQMAPPQAFCAQCGAGLIENAQFCKGCGAKVG